MEYDPQPCSIKRKASESTLRLQYDMVFDPVKRWIVVLQFIDDVLDFTSSSGELGKPNLNDIKSGVVTAPVLFAAEEHPELVEMIQRKFKGDGDVARANELVFDSRGIQRTRNMADEHCKLAADTVSPLLLHCVVMFVWYRAQDAGHCC